MLRAIIERIALNPAIPGFHGINYLVHFVHVCHLSIEQPYNKSGSP